LKTFGKNNCADISVETTARQRGEAEKL